MSEAEPTKAELAVAGVISTIPLAIVFGPCCLKFGVILLLIAALIKYLVN